MNQPVSTGILQELLRDHLGDVGVEVVGSCICCVEQGGHSGNDFFQAEVTWEGEKGRTSARWMIKKWVNGNRTASLMEVTQPLEALAWKEGLMNRVLLPEGMSVPFIGTYTEPENTCAWIALEDVTEELAAFPGSVGDEELYDRSRWILDRLACFHAHWERTDRFDRLQGYPWLMPQERHLRCLSQLYSDCLGWEPHSGAAEPGPRKGVVEFLRWLPESDRPLWEEHLYDRERLIAACVDLPQTLLHGDFHRGNIGLRSGREQVELVVIDWEWIGLGTPAIDVIQFADHLGLPDEKVQSLLDCYFDRYTDHGGAQMDRSIWERSCDLAFIAYALRPFPMNVPFFLQQGAESAERARRKAERVTRAMRQWL